MFVLKSEKAKTVRGPKRPLTGFWRLSGWLRDLVVVAITVVGLTLLMVPSAKTWFNLREQAEMVTGYTTTVTSISPQVRTDLLEQAKQHNATMPPGPFRDPYAVTDATDPAAVASATSAYNSLLAGDPAGVMASIQIPSIGVNLPIYHGVDSDTLERGVGHMPQTSLPVGGSGTHAVLVAHTGVANAPLFSNLDKVKLGDTFSIQVMGELLYYQVDQILVVLPDDLDALQLVPGQDYVTLVTCTPKWVNSHRLLVRGTRIDPPASATALASDMGSPRFTALPTIAGPGFPWWGVIILGGAVIAVVVCRVVLTPAKRRRKARTDPAADPVTDPRPDPGVNPEPGRATA